MTGPRSKLFHATWFAILAFPGWSARLLTTHDIVSMRSLQSVALSPNGRSVAYVVSEPVPDEQSKAAANLEIWLVSASGGTPRRCTENPGPDSSPQWSPDGSSIAFLSHRSGDEGTQIYLMDSSCDNVHRLIRHDTSISSFTWSPDGKRIVFLAAEPKTKDQRHQEQIGNDEMVFSISDNDRHASPQKLWMADSSSGALRLVPVGPYHVSGAVWSPDGRKLLITLSERNDMDAEWIRSRLAVVPPDGGEPRTYCSTTGKFARPRWRPDGKAVSFLGASAGGREPAASSFYICDGEGATPVNLSSGAPFTIASYHWLPSGETVLMTIVEKNSRYLARFDPSKRKFSKVSANGQVFSNDISLSGDSETLACFIETPHEPADVFTGPVAGPLQRVTHLNRQLEEISYGEAEDVDWKAKDGLEITGILIKPVGYQAGRKYPLIVQAHGGPEGADLNGFQINWGQFLAANGYAVLLPNFRGSTGRGIQYTLEDNQNFGGGDFQDIMAGVDELIRRGIADPDRLGIGGWSYGGFMSAWAPTQTTRFKASVMGAGVSNWYSLMGETPLPLWTVQVHFEAWPYDDPHVFRKSSPIEFVKQVRTPILILHGEVDPMIPLSQARQYFRALRHYNVPAELVVFPREGHGLREPVHRKQAYVRILAWYDKYVKNATP